jgi:hypothetical protein
MDVMRLAAAHLYCFKPGHRPRGFIKFSSSAEAGPETG